MWIQRCFSRNTIMQDPARILLTVLPAAVFFLICGTAGADVQQGATDPCAQTSTAALTACQSQTSAAFWLAKGKCHNLSDPAGKEQCLQTADDELASALELCQEQFVARNEVCAELGGGAYDPEIDPEDFVQNVQGNSYFPLTPNTVLTYESDSERIVVRVTNKTKKILGITCRVVRDTVTDKETGKLVEDTVDWLAQDTDGNVWYFGEISQEFDEQGELVSLQGSWKAGVNGAKPGIIMEAKPKKGDVYRQEFLLGEAEDLARVSGIGRTVTVPAGTYNNCLKTEDFTPFDPGLKERKFYAPGVGLVLTIDPDGTREELVTVAQE